MKPELYEHQKIILKEDKHKCGLFLGTGSCKTLTALLLAEGPTLVVCPKQQRDDLTWERENEKWETNVDLTVISKEDLRKMWDELPAYTTVIFDECHFHVGVHPRKVQRNLMQKPSWSKIFEATLNYIRKNNPKRLYLLSATPVPKPMSMWGIGTLFGQKWDFDEFRETFYFKVRMGARHEVWIPKTDEASKQRLATLVQKFGYTGGLNDFFDVPEQNHVVVKFDLTKAQEDAIYELNRLESDPLVRAAKLRTIENGVIYGTIIEELTGKIDQMTCLTTLLKSDKMEYIVDRALEFPKLLIFATYTAQIMEIARVLRKEGYKVSVLNGKTKDRTFIKKVNDSPDPHIIVAQSSMSSGYELPTFPCCIFASKDWRFLSYEQGCGRILRANHLKKNLFIHLVTKGGSDEACHKSIMEGADFQEKLTLNIGIDKVDGDTL